MVRGVGRLPGELSRKESAESVRRGLGKVSWEAQVLAAPSPLGDGGNFRGELMGRSGAGHRLEPMPHAFGRGLLVADTTVSLNRVG